MMMTNFPHVRVAARNERGVALIIAIMAIIVVGSLISGVFAVVVLENRAAQNSRPMEQAFAAAEQGITETLAGWGSGGWNMLAVLDSSPISGATPAGTGRYDGMLRRLNPELFFIDVTGTSTRGGARQRIGSFVRLTPLTIEIDAALTTRAPGRVGGTAAISGSDRPPPEWDDCPPTGDDKPGIRVPDDRDLRFTGGCGGASCVEGGVDEDPTVTDSTFFNYGDLDWDGLVAYATKRLGAGNYQNLAPSVTDDDLCDVSDPNNWGDPLNDDEPCSNYFPIIYVDGDLTVNTGVGQGLLLVDGDLNAQGNFTFYGIVIVRGRLRTAGSGNRFNGGVMAANVDFDFNAVEGDVNISFSSCAVARARNAALPGAPLRSRNWLRLY
jgi:hypothetical protein